MQPGIYFATIDGMVRQKELAVRAQNLANISTPAYKKERVSFSQYFSSVIEKEKTDFSEGDVRPTGNPLDVAISGQEDAFFVVKTPKGEFYTRRGDFTLDKRGRLITHTGLPVQGMRGDILVKGSKVQIDERGRVIVDGKVIDTLKIISLPVDTLKRLGDDLFFRPAQTKDISASETQLDQIISSAAYKYGVDENLIKAIIKVESDFDSQAVSPKGALGLMQLMPKTVLKFGVMDPFDPYQNVDAGTRYLKQLLEKFGDLDLALTAYNAGPSAVGRNGKMPNIPEVRQYVKRVRAALSQFKASAGEATSISSAEPEGYKVLQGYLEESNVKPVEEMVTMVDCLRNYEICQKIIHSQDESTGKAINEVGIVRA